MLKPLTTALLALTVSLSAAPAFAVKRCGWLQNPTPGNYFLTDRDGDWWIAAQGSDLDPTGSDLIGDLSEGDYVKTNGYYGYACACLDMEVDAASKNVVSIKSFKQLAIKQCRNDKALPAPDA